MIQDRLIVCIGSSWDYDPTSKHHIMRHLSRDNEILWINYHGTRRPTLGRSDLRDALGALRRVAKGLRRATPSISVLTPMVLPGATRASLRRVHRRLLIAQIRRALRTVAGESHRPVQLWTFAPDVPYLINAFDEETSVYYCVDEYSQFSGFDGHAIATAERELIQKADVVIASSESLAREKRRHRRDVALVSHGVDFDHFASAWRSRLDRPADLRGIKGPVFGYFGLIHHWVDRALLAEVARRRPGYSFVLLGDCKVDAGELNALPNVHLLGRRPYQSLPAYAAAFDAGLLLFAQNAMTRHVNPVKMYEYLAAGLSVVSTPLPEARRFEGPIVIADGAGPFADACDLVLRRDRHNRRAISDCVREQTWDAKVRQLSDVVTRRTDPRTGPTKTIDRDALPTIKSSPLAPVCSDGVAHSPIPETCSTSTSE